MKTKKRIIKIQDSLCELTLRVERLNDLINAKCIIQVPNGWEPFVPKYPEPFTTGTPLPPNPTITVSVDDNITSSTVTNKDDVPFTFTGEQK